ncbi:hypothetical protein GCM10009651_12450 [Microbacterium natoriense]
MRLLTLSHAGVDGEGLWNSVSQFSDPHRGGVDGRSTQGHPPATDPSRDDAPIAQVLEDAQEHGLGLDVLVETGTA